MESATLEAQPMRRAAAARARGLLARLRVAWSWSRWGGVRQRVAVRRALAERSAFPSSVHGSDGVVVWCNDAFARLCGRSAEDCRQHTLDELLGLSPADDPTRLQLLRWMTAAQEGRCVVGGRVAGRELSLQAEVLGLLRETEGAAHALVNWYDQTEHVRTQRQLQQVLVERTYERERLGHILAGTQVGAWEINLITGEARMDEAWAAMFGWRRAELEPWNRAKAREMLHEADRAATDEQVRRHLAGELPAVDVEQRVRHRDGEWVWVHSRGKVATWAADGRPEWLSGSHMDIRERKRQQAELEGQRAYMRLLLSSLPGVVFEVELDAARQIRATYLSEGLRTLFGIEPARALADPSLLLRTVSDEDRVAIMRAFDESARGMTLMEVEYRVTTHGQQRWLSLHAQPSHQGDGGLHWHGMLLDVTRRHELAEQLAQARAAAEEASRAKSAFLATMSHEIRSPMNGVLGMTDVLMSAASPEDQSEAVQVIRESAGALLTLIDDILDFSKIEAGRLDLERLPVNPALLLETVAESLASSTAAENVSVSVRLAPGLPHQVWSDPTRLRQILYNLLGNAIKFSRRTRDEPGRVRAVLMRADPPSPGLVFRIEDDGIGMDAETQARLFHPFTQADASTTRRFGGTGLGLAIVKRLVDAMQGRLHLDSWPGEGSRFDVWLPLEVADATHERAPVDLSGLPCVIVGGDDEGVAALAQALCGAGASVRRVPTLQALQQICSEPQAGCVIAVLPREGAPAAVTGDVADLVALRQACGCDLRFLLLASKGRSLPLELVAPDVGVVRALRRHKLWRSLAAMAGRASPELPVPRAGWAGALATRGAVDTGARTEAPRVLVVDDEATNRKVAVHQLQLLDVQADVACDGEEALQRWRSGAYALVLTDLHMPRLDGYAFARRLRDEERQRGGPRTPVLALTANALRGEEHRAREAGIDAYLTKPIPLDALHAALARWLPVAGSAAEAPLAATPEPAVLDLNVLRSLIGDDAAVVGEFLAHFRQSFGQHTDELRRAFGSGDLTRVAGTAHKLKSSARALGAQTLARLCEALESQRSSHDATERARVWLDFERAVEALDQALQQAEEAHR